MQSGPGKTERWRLDWDILPGGSRWENPLMGWASSADYMQGTRLSFRSKEDAAHFAEKQGWDYYVQPEVVKRIPPKNYAENYVYKPHKLRIARTKPYSKNYSGLVNQTVIGIVITVLCITGQELMKRRRRKGKAKPTGEGLGSRESWEFGYLYQGRSWARVPSPASPAGWPLSWVKEVINYNEDEMHSLRGVDATLYVRFLRGCFWFSLLHTLTTFPILFPIHVEFSDDQVPSKSMTRASISSLVETEKGQSLLWIHICLLFWIVLSWMTTLIWICNGAFRLRARSIILAATRKREAVENPDSVNNILYPHPHPQYAFQAVPALDSNHPNFGLRLRTVMVSNVPHTLRDERELKEYFEYWLSRKIEKPSMGITSSTQPGMLNKTAAYFFNRAKKLPAKVQNVLPISAKEDGRPSEEDKGPQPDTPLVERVVIARKMTELASLLERREEILRLLETAHIKLANRALLDVKEAMDRKKSRKPAERSANSRKPMEEEERMERLIEVLGPYVREFGMDKKPRKRDFAITKRLRHVRESSDSSGSSSEGQHYRLIVSPLSLKLGRLKHVSPAEPFGMPSSVSRGVLLMRIQPLVNLSHLFRGRTVPAIDYYTAKYNLLTSLITENRAKAASDFDAVSTAACKYLAVHPKNPLTCLVTMAPEYQDLDWIRVMKSSFNGEFVKDWIVNVGVWGFTIFWLFPVSLLVGLVSIQNISLFWPSLKHYLDHHPWQSEVIQSFLPTLLVALLALLIPLILLLIAKKAHTITTLSALHDLIMTRYYKFLIVNVLSFKNVAGMKLIEIVSASFPSAGPFYVGWLIFTTAMHGGFEILLSSSDHVSYHVETSDTYSGARGLLEFDHVPLIITMCFPNHLLVIHVLLVFAVLNPFVLPFGTLYFFVQSESTHSTFTRRTTKEMARSLLIRMVRYSLDGMILSLVVMLAYMVVLKKSANVGLCVFLIALTAVFKLINPASNNGPSSPDIVPDYMENTKSLESRTRSANDPTSTKTGESLYPSTAIPRVPHRGFLPSNLGIAPSQITEEPKDGPPPQRPNATPVQRSKLTNIGAQTGSAGPVVPHPPPLPWDDHQSVDLPYDNPYYTREISNALWLPRDPVNVLDLDDYSGHEGRFDRSIWLPGKLEPGSKTSTFLLPIKQRVQANERGIEQTTRPRRSTVSHAISNRSDGGTLTLLSARRRPSALELQTTMRSVSDGASPPFLRPRSTSAVSALHLGPPAMSSSKLSSGEQEFGLRPDTHAQAELVAAMTTSKVSLAPSKMARSQNLSAQTAILHEILAEEKQALYERLQDEQVEATKESSTNTNSGLLEEFIIMRNYDLSDPSFFPVLHLQFCAIVARQSSEESTAGIRLEARAGEIVWDGTFNNFASPADFDKWRNSFPRPPANLGTGNLFYHFSVKRTNTNAPDTTLEHQVMFFESHFTELKYGVGPNGGNLVWMIGAWTDCLPKTIQFDAKTVGLWASKNGEPLARVANNQAASTSTNSADFHVGVLRITNRNPPEDWYFSGVYIEKGPITTAQGSGNGTVTTTTGGTTTTTPTTTTTVTTPTTTTTTPEGPLQSLYGQCGGTGWTGPTNCAPPATCKPVSAPYYSQGLLTYSNASANRERYLEEKL
ncbi:hypothetical protein DFP72DRAFT_845840 [Ephemerocybe angulata]|uniref:CBM1 domain-containing protein n=1 Tax=Ephemerocybe angulata TaxID=980116 RepID=A0A8H6I4V8_9AGAR|nr:hypothetical protein DFP72DRAFT_845840 [Tulosesus angulatus]